MYMFEHKCDLIPVGNLMHRMLVYLTIRQQGGVVYERIVDEGETWVNYLLIANEAELSIVLV